MAAVSEKVKAFLLHKTGEIAACGTDVILDWGFWKRTERAETTAYFTEKGIAFIWYYLDISDARWREQIARRNAAPGPADYYVDEGLLQKCVRRFEAPDAEELKTWQIIY